MKGSLTLITCGNEKSISIYLSSLKLVQSKKENQQSLKSLILLYLSIAWRAINANSKSSQDQSMISSCLEM